MLRARQPHFSPYLAQIGPGSPRQGRVPGTSEVRRKNSPGPLKSSNRATQSRDFLAAGTGNKLKHPTLAIGACGNFLCFGRWTRGDHEDRFQILQPAGDRLLPGQPAVQPRRHPSVLARRQPRYCLQPRRVCMHRNSALGMVGCGMWDACANPRPATSRTPSPSPTERTSRGSASPRRATSCCPSTRMARPC